jgi:Arc/MetJ-type ribon-helix-helix transcriptional regulator
MNTMSPENKRFLERAIAEGRFANQGQALDEAIHLLRKREELLTAVNRGVEQLDGGQYVEYQDTEVEQFIADIETHARRTLAGD